MIPRYQRILFWSLGGGILLLFAFLLYGCQEARRRLAVFDNETPIAAPNGAQEETVSLYLANDRDGSVKVESRQLALPAEPTLRARSLLQQLLAGYGLPESEHRLPSGPAVDDVFLVRLPVVNPAGGGSPAPAGRGVQPMPSYASPAGLTGELAVISLSRSFADNHPSGIETENGTVLSIIGTLHAAFPEITQIRFLVEGQPRDSLAGHVDLNRSYPALDTATQPEQPHPEDATP